MNVDGSGLARVNHGRGYAGGAFFSPDGQRLVYRAFYPSTPSEEEAWQRMLREHALVPVPMEIYVARPDGSEERAVTKTGKVNFAPMFHPDGKRILFCSNLEARQRGAYDLWLVNADGSGLERVTRQAGAGEHPSFDGFPCFSPDGRRLAWISDRGGDGLNVFSPAGETDPRTAATEPQSAQRKTFCCRTPQRPPGGPSGGGSIKGFFSAGSEALRPPDGTYWFLSWSILSRSRSISLLSASIFFFWESTVFFCDSAVSWLFFNSSSSAATLVSSVFFSSPRAGGSSSRRPRTSPASARGRPTPRPASS